MDYLNFEKSFNFFQGTFNGGIWKTCKRESKCQSWCPVQPPKRYYWSVNRKCMVKHFLFIKLSIILQKLKFFFLLCNKLNSTALTTSYSNHLWGIEVFGASVLPLTHERQCDVVKSIFLKNTHYPLSVAVCKLQTISLCYIAKIWLNLCAINVYFY